MKRVIVLGLCVLFLSGCSAGHAAESLKDYEVKCYSCGTLIYEDSFSGEVYGPYNYATTWKIKKSTGENIEISGECVVLR